MPAPDDAPAPVAEKKVESSSTDEAMSFGRQLFAFLVFVFFIVPIAVLIVALFFGP
mgnify:CR=1 FL=1